MGRARGARSEQGLTGGPAVLQCRLRFIGIFFKLIRIDSIKKLPSIAQNFSNKICMRKKFNKEQINMFICLRIDYLLKLVLD
jgi:hypothetical protein